MFLLQIVFPFLYMNSSSLCGHFFTVNISWQHSTIPFLLTISLRHGMRNPFLRHPRGQLPACSFISSFPRWRQINIAVAGYWKCSKIGIFMFHLPGKPQFTNNKSVSCVCQHNKHEWMWFVSLEAFGLNHLLFYSLLVLSPRFHYSLSVPSWRLHGCRKAISKTPSENHFPSSPLSFSIFPNEFARFARG